MPVKKGTPAIEQVAGALVWWEFDGVLVTPADAQRVLAAHNMDLEVQVPAISSESAIRKAASAFTAGRDRRTRIRAKVVGVYDDGSIEVALVQDYAHKGKGTTAVPTVHKAGANQIDSVVFDTNTDSWLYSGTTADAVKFIALADEKRIYLGSDFVRQRIVHGPLAAAGAFPLRRRQGGFYFVPSASVGKAVRIQAVLDALPAECELLIAEINTSAASKQSIGKAATDWLVAGVADFKSRLAFWKDQHRLPRAGTVSKAMMEFTGLKEHAALYRDALNLELTDLDEQIREAIDLAQDIVGAANRGVPHSFIRVVKALVSSHGLGVEIPYAEIGKTGLPSYASDDYAKTFWTGRSERGTLAAREAGWLSEVTEAGVTFAPLPTPAAPPEPSVVEPDAIPEPPNPITEPAPETATPPALADDEDLADDLVMALNEEQLRGAIAALGEPVPAGATLKNLREIAREAMGLGS